MDELFRQYVEVVEVVAADAVSQLAWIDQMRVPSDEIRQQLDDAVFSFQERLVGSGRLSEAGLSAVASIVAEFDSWDDEALWRSDQALIERIE